MAVAKEEKRTILEKFGDIDRRIIYAMVFLMIVPPLLFPLNLPIGISPETSAIFKFINNLPKGSIVVLSLDFGSKIGENYPQARTVFAHALRAGMKVILMGMWSYGATVSANFLVEETKAYAQARGIGEITSAMATYGVNYVNLGIILQGDNGVMQLAQVGFYPQMFSKDNYGNKLEDLPFNKAGKPITQFKAEDVDLLVCYAAGTPGIEAYRTYWWATGKCLNLAVGAVGVSVAGYYPLMNAGILIGIIPSTKGAMEYDQLTGMIGASGLSLSTMDAQSLEHVYVIVLLVIGNIGTFAISRSRRRGT